MTLKHFLWYQLPSEAETVADNIHLMRTIYNFLYLGQFSVCKHKISHQGEPIRCLGLASRPPITVFGLT